MRTQTDLSAIGYGHHFHFACHGLVSKRIVSFGKLRDQRRRLLDELRQTASGSAGTAAVALATGSDEAAPAFEAALPLLLTILGLAR